MNAILSRHPLLVAMTFLVAASGCAAQETARLERPSTRHSATDVAPDTLHLDLYCGDAVSEALHSTPDMPCWADIRSADRWHPSSLRAGELMRPAENNGQPSADYNRASIAGGFIQATSFAHGDNPTAYGGILAAAVTASRHRWRVNAENVSSGVAFRSGTIAALGLNRAALRFGVELTPRLALQARVTNTFGTDSFRSFAPLDDRSVGVTSAPVSETATYGLHGGHMLDAQEDADVRYASSRRTSIDMAIIHSLVRYSDVGSTVQALSSRAEVLHAVSPDIALGAFALVATQTADRHALYLEACSLSGGGFASEVKSPNFTIRFNGGLAKGSSGCGGSLQPIGTLAITIPVGQGNAMFLTLDRSLSRGVLLSAPMLASTVIGVQHNFTSAARLQIAGGGVYGEGAHNHVQTTGVFADLGVHYRIGRYLMQETTVRRFQNTAVDRGPGVSPGRTILTFSLWLTRPAANGNRD